jgi:hypothetical protein
MAETILYAPVYLLISTKVQFRSYAFPVLMIKWLVMALRKRTSAASI